MNIKRTLAIVLSVLTIFSLFPTAAFAYEQKAPYILYGGSDTDSSAEENHNDIIGTYVDLENYDGGCIEIDLAHQYDDKTDADNERFVTFRLLGDNVIHVDKPSMFNYDDYLCGIICTNGMNNGVRQEGNIKLEGYNGATLTIVNEIGNTESAKKDILALLGMYANNITIENLDVKVVFKTNEENADFVLLTTGILAKGTVYTLGTTSIDIDLDIMCKSTTAIGIYSGVKEDNGRKYGTLVQSTGDINVNVRSSGVANCLSYPLNVKIDRKAGQYIPDIYLSTNPGNLLHLLSNDTKDKEPAIFPDGSVSEYGFANGDAYCAIDKDRHTEKKTVNADDVTKAFPKIVNGEEVVTRFEGETFTGFITWYRDSQKTGTLKTYDEIKDGSYCYVSLVPKSGYTFNGIKANAYTVPGATVKNSADSGYFTATFNKKNVVNDNLSIIIECNGVKQKDIGIAEAELTDGQKATATATLGGKFSAEPQVKWYLETCYRKKTKQGYVIATESKEEVGTGKTVSLKGEYKSGKFYFLSAQVTPFMGTAFSSKKIRINVTTATPTITKQPESVYAGRNSQMHFEVEAIGGELSYQWKWEDEQGYTGDFKESEYVSGAKTSSLTYTPSSVNDTCRVWCEVSNAHGKANTNRVDCVVYQQCTIIKDLPTTIYVEPGDDVTLEVEAVAPDNNKDLRYEWAFENYNSHKGGGISLFRNGQLGTVITDGGKLTIKNVTWDEINQFEFFCYVGVAPQAPIKSTRVRFKKPENYVSEIEITGVTAPADGKNASFNCTVPTGKGYSIKGSAVWTDASGEALTKDSTFAATEKYTFSVTLKTDDNTAFKKDCTATVNGRKANVVKIKGSSNEVTVSCTFTAIQKPKFVYALGDKTVSEGENVTFAVKVKNFSGVKYQWFKNGTIVNGATDNEYTFKATAADNGAVVFCVASNEAGETFSEQATLTVRKKLLLGNISNHGTGDSVSVSDARLVLRAAVKLDTLTGIDLILADIDGGGVSVSDARLVLRMAVKLDSMQYTDKY